MSAFVTLTAASSPGPIEGVWGNRKGTVRIRTYRCAANICARIVFASEQAEAEASRKGRGPLLGRQIFFDFHPIADGSWRGRIYVPDLAKTFTGNLRVTAEDTLEGKGCVLGGMICKDKTWYRVLDQDIAHSIVDVGG